MAIPVRAYVAFYMALFASVSRREQLKEPNMYSRYPIQKFAHRHSLKIRSINGSDGAFVALPYYSSVSGTKSFLV